MKPVDPFSIAMRRTYAISIGATLLLLVTVVTGGYLGLQTQQRFRNVSSSWSTFAESAEQKGVLISEVRGHLGYGGIIHNFKNYVLRQEARYATAMRQQLVAFYQTIDRFLASNISVSERTALSTIRQTIATYEAQLPIADQAARERWEIADTDRRVRVDDQGAIHALATLEDTWRTRRDHATKDAIRSVGEGESLIDLGFDFLVGLGLVSVALLVLYYMLARQIHEAFTRLSSELVDRLRAEQSEKKFLRAVEQSPATIIITDTRGHIEYVNRRFEELTGYSRSEVVGSTPRFLQSGETAAEQYGSIRALLARGREWRGVFRNRRKDGSSYWAETTIFPLTDDDGITRNFIGVAEDISEKRQAREQVIKAQKLEAVALLAGGVAHDFNNVLTTILGAAHLASLDAEADSDIAREVAQIEIAARRAQSLVQQLLTFARRQPGRARALDLAREVREVVRLVQASVPKTIQVRAELGDQRMWVRADPTHLHQIIMNLCRNAAEAVPPDAGVIQISISPHEVAEGSTDAPSSSRTTIRLVVSDNGPGIAPDVSKRMFDAFYTTKPVGKGTGLGLTMVSTLLDEMGGSIALVAPQDGGACFEIMLPACTPGEDVPETAGELPRGSENILLVDDEDDVLATQRRVLMRLGYRVSAFSDPVTALAAFAKEPGRFDIVLTDLVMPGMNGETLAGEVRRLKPDCPIILCSAYQPGSSEHRETLPLVAMAKPVSPADLARQLRALLDPLAPSRRDQREAAMLRNNS